MLLQIPRSVIEKGDNGDPARELALAASLSPSRFKSVTTWEKCSPCAAEKVGDEDNKRAGDGDGRRFELDEAGSARKYRARPPFEPQVLLLSHRVDLAHDGLESREASG